MPRPAAATEEALILSESITLAIEEGATTIFDADGCVPVHIIRPGVGKGRGRHLYEATMLQRNAHKFNNWRMFVDHLSPEARKAAGGLPRSVRDLGGRIIESDWDPTVPADPVKGYGQGAVVGRARPVPFMRDLIENDPGLIEASISAAATGVHPVNHKGQRVWCVEGIEDRGSVDWVTEAGAGGRVAPLLESSYASEEAVEMALLESMTDDEVIEFVRESRPHLTIAEAEAEGGKGDPEDDPEDGKTPKPKPEDDVQESEEDNMPLTPEALQEAFTEHPEVLAEAIKGSTLIEGLLDERVRAAMAEDHTVSAAERDAVIDRQWALRDLRDEAHKLIAESRLPETWQESLRDRFTLREDRSPTADLDVVDDIDSAGAVTKTALEKLRESVDAACKVERRRLAEVAPTRVRGQGPASGEPDDENLPKGEPGFHRTLLAEAGIDPDKAWVGV